MTCLCPSPAMSDFNLTRNYPLGVGNVSLRHSTTRKHCTMVDAEADTMRLDELFHSTFKYANEVNSRICERPENEKQAMGDNQLCKDVEKDLLFTEVTTKSIDYYRGMIQDKLSTRRDMLEKTRQDLVDSFNHLSCAARQVENNDAYNGLNKELQNLRALVKILEVAAERYGVSNSESRFLGDLANVVRCLDCMNRQHESALCEIEKLKAANKDLWNQNSQICTYSNDEFMKRSPYEGETIRHSCRAISNEGNKCICYHCKSTILCEPDNKVQSCEDQSCTKCQINTKTQCNSEPSKCQKCRDNEPVAACEDEPNESDKLCKTCKICKSPENNNNACEEPCKIASCKTLETCKCVKMKCGYPKLASKNHQPCDPCKPCSQKKLCNSCKHCCKCQPCNCHQQQCDSCNTCQVSKCKSCTICQSCDQCNASLPPSCKTCHYCKPCNACPKCQQCKPCQPCQCPPSIYKQLQHICFSVPPPCDDVPDCPDEPSCENTAVCPCPSDNEKCEPCLAQPKKRKKTGSPKKQMVAICDEEPCQKKPRRKSKKKCSTPAPCPPTPPPCPPTQPPCPPEPCPTPCLPAPCSMHPQCPPMPPCPPMQWPVVPCPQTPCPSGQCPLSPSGEKSCFIERQPVTCAMQTTCSIPCDCDECPLDYRQPCVGRRSVCIGKDATEESLQYRDLPISRPEGEDLCAACPIPIMTEQEMREAARVRRRKKMFWIGLALLTMAMLIMLACHLWEWIKSRSAIEDALCKSCSTITKEEEEEEYKANTENSESIWNIF